MRYGQKWREMYEHIPLPAEAGGIRPRETVLLCMAVSYNASQSATLWNEIVTYCLLSQRMKHTLCLSTSLPYLKMWTQLALKKKRALEIGKMIGGNWEDLERKDCQKVDLIKPVYGHILEDHTLYDRHRQWTSTDYRCQCPWLLGWTWTNCATFFSFVKYEKL